MSAEMITIESDSHGKYAWFCAECGWAGLQCDTHSFAAAEGNRHLAQNHGFPVARSSHKTGRETDG